MFFITFLRAISAMIITNAHYTGIYPNDIIANGGLLGDVLFFAVSGYCLCNVKLSFGKWYLKRLIRIYPPVIIISLLYLALGFYKCTGFGSVIELFVYPTYYHFVASILLLYIPFYIVMKTELLSKRLPMVMGITFAIQLLIYLFAYDKTYYHIDSVHEYFIRFLFFNSMLIGAYVRKRDNDFRKKPKKLNIIIMVLLLPTYFVSKLSFSRYAQLAPFQIFNQVILLTLLYFVFVALCGLDSKLEKMPDKLKKAIDFIAKHTLEIYLVQSVIIVELRNLGLAFPINWIVITASIAVSAILLHIVSQFVIKNIQKLLENKLKIKL